MIIIGLGFLHEMTAFMTYNWYMLILIIPIMPIASIFQIINLIKGKIDVNSDIQISPRAEPIDIWVVLIWVVLTPLIWLVPIIVDVGLASLSVFIKHQLFGKVSLDDVYLICGIIPVCLISIPCFFAKLREILPKGIKAYIYDSMGIVGIAANILVLVVGGWLTVTVG